MSAVARPKTTAGDLPWQVQKLFTDLYRYTLFAENGRVFLGFSEEVVRAIIADRFSKGRLLFHRDEDGEIDGMFAWYRFKDGWQWEDILDWRQDDEDGSEFFLAYLFADSKKIMSDFALNMIAKEPDVIAGNLTGIRHRKGRPQKVEYSNRFLAKLLKLKN